SRFLLQIRFWVEPRENSQGDEPQRRRPSNSHADAFQIPLRLAFVKMSPEMVEMKKQQQPGNAVVKQIARRLDREIGRAASARAAARLIATGTSSRGALLMLRSGMPPPGPVAAAQAAALH